MIAARSRFLQLCRGTLAQEFPFRDCVERARPWRGRTKDRAIPHRWKARFDLGSDNLQLCPRKHFHAVRATPEVSWPHNLLYAGQTLTFSVFTEVSAMTGSAPTADLSRDQQDLRAV